MKFWACLFFYFYYFSENLQTWIILSGLSPQNGKKTYISLYILNSKHTYLFTKNIPTAFMITLFHWEIHVFDKYLMHFICDINGFYLFINRHLRIFRYFLFIHICHLNDIVIYHEPCKRDIFQQLIPFIHILSAFSELSLKIHV